MEKNLHKIYSVFFIVLLLFKIDISKAEQIFDKDSLLVIESEPQKGFHYEYVLFIPKGFDKSESTTLLVEPNNTGFPTDYMEIHLGQAVFVAARSSVGNAVSKTIKIPLLVPVFPRPQSDWRLYTHMLDSDIIKTKREKLIRLDLQLISMVEDARNKLKIMGIDTDKRFFMNGFSASGSFANRFSLIHPKKVKAVAAGGLNALLMLPQKKVDTHAIYYPIGLSNFEKLFGKKFNQKAFSKVPQFYYMGSEDTNDAVSYNDAYNDEERQVILKIYGNKMMPDRWQKIQSYYSESKINATFKTYEGIGHGTTSQMNNEIAEFFKSKL